MPDWATVSIRSELVEEVRKLMRRTGRYRSISEFVAEAIRLRLEEMAQRGEFAHEPIEEPLPTQHVQTTQVAMTPDMTEGTRGYINVQLQRIEQTWWVLVRLFGDLLRKDVQVETECAQQLRNCRTTMNFVRSHISPECDIELANQRLPELQQNVDQVRRDLIATAIGFHDDYARDWILELDRAEKGELRESPATGSRFVPGLPRNDVGWTRVTLTKPVPKNSVEEISNVLGVMVKSEDSLHFVVSGEKKTVKKAVEMLYQLQSR
jgi:Arc/MetJ-type ribon-helix-helix transcriptional regulator